MSSFGNVHHSLEDRFKTLITSGGDGGDPIVTRFANDPKVGGAADGDAWARVTVKAATDRKQADFGDSTVRVRGEGQLLAELYVPYSSGSLESTVLADRVRAAFSRVTVTQGNSRYTFRTPSLLNGSSGDRQGKWWRVVVVCPFFSDDIE